VPQVEAAIVMHTRAGSISPSGTGWQVPGLPGTAQEAQLSQLPAAQQKPSVQWPLKHSAPAAQAAPFGLRFVQAFAMQVKPPAQSPSPSQVVRQAAAPQANGAQLAGGCRHAPAPSQFPTGVKVDPVHEALPQLVVAGAFRQAPLPSHLPLNPHGGAGAHPPCGSMSSAITGWHIPAVPGTLHDWQLPQEAAAQQTPSVQRALSHSAPPEHSWPRRLRPHEPALQTLPAAQSASAPQAALQVVPLHV
jgi:hypothetical protein